MSKTRPSRVLPAALAIIATTALVACGAGTDPESPTETAPATAAATSREDAASAGSLTIVVEGGGLAQLQPIADSFTEETGTAVTFVELPYDSLYDRISSELASGDLSFDVVAVDAIWMSAFGPALEPIDDLFTADVEADLFPALLEEATFDGHYVGMPAWTNAQILLYRTDLFDDPEEQAAFEAEYGYALAAPTTWNEYNDAAAFFTRDIDGDGAIDLYGTDVKGGVETEWLALVLQAGSDAMVLDADGNVIINDANHLAALEEYVSNVEIAPPGAAQVGWAEAQNLFNQGQLAMTRFWAHAYTQVPSDSPVAGMVGAVPMPAGPGGVAGVPGAWYLSIPQGGEQGELASQFIKYSYENNELGLDTALGLAATRVALEEGAQLEGHENLGALLETLDAPGTTARPAVPEWQQIVDDALIPMLQQAVVPGADYQQLLDESMTQIEDIVS
ncbi:MAG TPA: extracellular solute-binding protein [Actinomycetaceae bacterium]|nr:extracellular solute-binding protein [Actinomycetaceae bacterium]